MRFPQIEIIHIFTGFAILCSLTVFMYYSYITDIAITNYTTWWAPNNNMMGMRLRRHDKLNTDNASDYWITQDDVHQSIFNQSDSYSKSRISELAAEYITSNDDFSTKPEKMRFIPEYRSPCWNDSARIRCLPAFYVTGFSKCATTDIWKHLIRHEQISDKYFRKEPNWWGWRRIVSNKYSLNSHVEKETYRKFLAGILKPSDKFYKLTMDQYLDNARVTEPNLLIGDGSTDTISSNIRLYTNLNFSNWSTNPSGQLMRALKDYRIALPHLIYQYTPNAKYILILRDPVERSFSAYLFTKRRKLSQAHFHELTLEGVRKYRDCLTKGHSVRYCCYYNPLGNHILMSPQIGQYIVYIVDMLKVIPRENLLILHFDDYVRSRSEVLGRVFQFLGVTIDRELLSQIDKEASPGINSRKTMKIDIGQMWNETKQILRSFYRPFNLELAQFLGDNRFLFEE